MAPEDCNSVAKRGWELPFGLDNCDSVPACKKIWGLNTGFIFFLSMANGHGDIGSLLERRLEDLSVRLIPIERGERDEGPFHLL
jgi:hypothetical protein